MIRDITRLDVRLLVAFEALIAEQNVTRAAEKAGLTQQGMSGQLARMRDLFGDPLFVRAKGGVVPTPRAEELIPIVRDALEGLEPLVSSVPFDPASYDGTVTIAASDYALALIMPPLLGRLHRKAPGLRLIVRPAGAESLEAEMRDGLIDFALTVPQFMKPGLPAMHLFDERYIGAVRAGHTLVSEGRVSVERFCAYPHLLVSPFRGNAFGPTDEALAVVGARRSIGLVVPGFSVVGSLLERTDLVAVLPERLVGTMHRNIQTFIPPVNIPGFSLCAYWTPRLDASQLHKWLRNEIAASASSA